jgi:tRNA(Arg) A34 adenosine deaminase TadA
MRRRTLLVFAAPVAAWAQPGAADPEATLAQAMRRAEVLRDAAVRAGDQPYGAVLWLNGRIVGDGPSRVVVNRDASAHAEREALRDAARRLGRSDLAGAVLVSTSRPCAACQAAARAAGVRRLVHGPDLREELVADAAPATMNLVAAAEAGDVAALRRLLDAGAAIEQRDERGRTALLAATHANRIEAARLLIARGADVNAKDAIADSPFLYAGAQGRLEILRLTLSAGADLASTNRYGGTALIPAAHHGHVDTVRELLKTKIAIDHVNRLGWTALLEAVILGDGGAAHERIVALLLAAGADPNRADRDGVTPLAHAEQRGQAAVAERLRKAGGRR